MSIELNNTPTKASISGSEFAIVDDNGTLKRAAINVFANYFNAVAAQIAAYSQTASDNAAVVSANLNSIVTAKDAAANSATTAATTLSTINSTSTTIQNNAVASAITPAATSATNAAATLTTLNNNSAALTAVATAAAATASNSVATLSPLTESLGSVTSLIHAGTAVNTFVYDTSKDSDGGAWRKRCNNTSWYNETICSGNWLGQKANELAARGDALNTYPQDLNNAIWTKIAGTVATGIADPWGGNAAQSWLETTANSGHNFSNLVTGIVSGTPYTSIAILKMNGRRYAGLYANNPVCGKMFDLQNGVIVGDLLGTPTNASITSLGNGWYMCTVTAVTNNTNSTGVAVYPSTDGTIISYTGNTSNGVYFAGGKIIVGSVPTAFVPHSQQSGQYFQSTADNKFYQLGNTYGNTTEVFRGNKREFPAVALLIAESIRVIIYDLTVPSCPMWRTFIRSTSSGIFPFWWKNTNDQVATSITACNGNIYFGVTNNGDPQSGLCGIELITDRLYKVKTSSAESGYSSVAIANWNNSNPQGLIINSFTTTIVSEKVNAVTCLILQDTPINPITGLPNPTIVVGTMGGTTIIKADGTVINLSTNKTQNVHFNNKYLICCGDDNGNPSGYGNPQVHFYNVPSFTLHQVITSGTVPNTNISGWGTSIFVTANAIASLSTNGFNFYNTPSKLLINKWNLNNLAASLISYIGKDHNTGYMVGDVRGSWLSDVITTDPTELISNPGPFTNTTGYSSVNSATLVAVANELQITSTGVAYPGAQIAITCTVGKTYNLIAVARCGTSSNIAFGISGITQIASNSITNTTLNYTFVATSTTHQVLCQIQGASANGQTAYFVSVSAKEVYSSPELITNGTFSTNDLTGWTNIGSGTSTVSAATGQLVLTNGATAAGNLASVQTTISCVIGRKYLLTVPFVSNTLGTNLFVYVSNSPNVNNTLTWTSGANTINILFEAVQTTEYIAFILSGTNNGSYTVDNVSVKLIEVDRGPKSNHLMLTGSLQKTAVNTNSQLVGYNNWSNVAAFTQPYNSSLDVTNSFNISAWINPPSNIVINNTATFPITTGPNLVVNGGFNTNTTGWFVNPAATITSVNGQLQLTAIVAGGYPQASQAITTVAGKFYRVRFQYKNGTTPHSVGFATDNTTPALNNTIQPTSTTTYQQYDKIFMANTTSMGIYLFLNTPSAAAGTAYFDNVEVREVTAIGANLNTNPYFDDGVWAWNGVNSTFNVTNGVAKCVSMGTSYGGVATTNTPMLQGKTYITSADIITNPSSKVVQLAHSTLNVAIDSNSGIGKVAGLYSNNSTVAGQLAVQFATNAVTNDYFEVDNVSAKEVIPTGAELIINGGFNADISSWGSGGTGVSLTWNAGVLRNTRGSTDSFAYQAVTTVIGRTYLVTITGIFGSGSGWLGYAGTSVGAADLGNTSSLATTGTQTRSFIFTASSVTTYISCYTYGAANSYNDFDNISVKEVTNPATEKITNPGGPFTNTTGWSTNAGTIALVGNEIELTGTGVGSRFEQVLTLTPGSYYLVSGNIRGGDLTCRVNIIRGAAGSYATIKNDGISVIAGSATSGFFVFQALATDYILQVQSNSGSGIGKIYAKSISVREIIPSVEAVGNPTFGTGLAGWSAPYQSSVTVTNSVLRMTATAENPYISQSFTVTPGKTYYISATLAAKSGVTWPVLFAGSTAGPSQQQLGTFSWTSLNSLTLIVQATTSLLNIQLVGNGCTAGDTFDFSNVSVREIGDGVTLLPTAYYTNITAVNAVSLGNGRYGLPAGSQLRSVFDYTKLKPSSTYLVQFTLEMLTGNPMYSTDWCDGSALAAASLGSTGLIQYKVFRNNYDSAYCFVDIAANFYNYAVVSNITIREVDPATIFDRSDLYGSSIKMSIDFFGRVICSVSDGTNSVVSYTPTPPAAGVWSKIRFNYYYGALTTAVNALPVMTAANYSIGSLANTGATLSIGNNNQMSSGLPPTMQLALLKISATVPTQNQMDYMFKAENQMFQANAKVTIDGPSSYISGLSYDEDNNLHHVATDWGRSTFSDLVRIDSEASTVGSVRSLTSGNGVLVTAGTSSKISIPSISLREEFRRKREARLALGKELVQFTYDTVTFTGTITSGSNIVTGVTSVVGTPYQGMSVSGTGIPAGATIAAINGTTYYLSANATASGAVTFGQLSFLLPNGYSVKNVLVNGVLKRSGITLTDTTKDYKLVLNDGFAETVYFNVSPGISSWVSIEATRNNT